MNTISQIFPKTGRISGPDVGDGAKPDFPTTDRQNEKKKKKHRPFYEAVDAHARRRLMNTRLVFNARKLIDSETHMNSDWLSLKLHFLRM